MKTLISVILTLLTIELSAQDIEIVLRADSLIIRDMNIATNPFSFGNDPLSHLTKSQPYPKIDTGLFENRYIPNKVDTLYSLTFGSDKIKIYKWSNESSAVLNASIATDRFSTKHGIKVGMEKTGIIKALQKYNIASIPKYLILENFEYTEVLIFEFTGKTLKKIEFQGYVD